MNQQTLMKFDPATRAEKPYPSHAAQWREWHGPLAWLFCPWTGRVRDAGDVGSDVFGHLILPPGEEIYVNKSQAQMGVLQAAPTQPAPAWNPNQRN